MEYSGSSLEIKSVSPEGTFDGICAVYSIRDDGGDVLEPNSFKEFDVTGDGSIRLLNSHNLAAPVGKGRLTDSAAGLRIKGN